jgi:hypothetical protein
MSPKDTPVSSITGRRQAPALRIATVLAIVTAALSMVSPAPLDETLATVALVLVTATPLLRVAWLIWRWIQEGDRRFALLGLALLGVVAFGAVASALGLGV